MKIVFDTVVVVRGLLDPFSWSGKLLFELGGHYEWVASPDIVDEYLDVLNRPKIATKFIAQENRDLATILARINRATIVHTPHVPAVCRDPSDDKFLAAAEAAGADFIVSEDNDLLSLREYMGTRICSPDVVLRELDLADGDGDGSR
jgi:putative PIN family toxin of toxin-antitoxin system